eukprot:s206_g22.t1
MLETSTLLWLRQDLSIRLSVALQAELVHYNPNSQIEFILIQFAVPNVNVGKALLGPGPCLLKALPKTSAEKLRASRQSVAARGAPGDVENAYAIYTKELTRFTQTGASARQEARLAACKAAASCNQLGQVSVHKNIEDFPTQSGCAHNSRTRSHTWRLHDDCSHLARVCACIQCKALVSGERGQLSLDSQQSKHGLQKERGAFDVLQPVSYKPASFAPALAGAADRASFQ